MADRSTITQVVQIGAEFVNGAEVVPTKRLQSISIEPSIAVNIEEFRPAGAKYRTLTALNKEWSTAAVSGKPTYTELPYILSGVIGAANLTTAGTITKIWTFTPNTYSADAPVTFSVRHGSSVRADKFAYGMFNEFGIKTTRSTLDISGSMFGQSITDGTTLQAPVVITDGVTNTDTSLVSPTASFSTAVHRGARVTGAGIAPNTRILSVTNATTVVLTIATTASASGVTVTIGAVDDLDLVPVLATEVSVYADDTPGAFGTTKLLRAISTDFKLGNRYNPIWVLNAAIQSFDGHVEIEPTATMNLMVEADAQGMGLLPTMRTGATKYIRVEAVAGANSIETGQAYTYTMDFCGKVVNTGGFSDSDGLYAIDWNLVAVHDPTFGKPFQIVVRNKLPVL